MNQYVMTDLHGCLKTFEHLISRVGFSKNDRLYLLGDLIDRGPDSKGVIDFVWKLKSEGYDIECIRGNHDQLMLNAYHSMESQRNWLFNGGWTTTESFQANTLKDIPIEYFHFIQNMHHFIEVDNFILVHAGLNFHSDQPLEDTQAMMWIRNWHKDIDYDWLRGGTIVHGHTPIPKEKTLEMMNNLGAQRYLNIDTGCVYKGKKKGLGFLTCFNLTNKQLTTQENIDW